MVIVKKAGTLIIFRCDNIRVIRSGV